MHIPMYAELLNVNIIFWYLDRISLLVPILPGAKG